MRQFFERAWYIILASSLMTVGVLAATFVLNQPGAGLNVLYFSCSGSVCPIAAPIDALGNPLTATLGSTTTSAESVQGQVGGIPVATNQTQVGGSTIVPSICQVNTRTYTPISITSIASTKVIVGASGKKTYICGILLTTAVANNIALVEGTGTNCGSSTTGVSGGSTSANGYNLPANGGLSIPFAGWPQMQTATNTDDFCIITSSAGPVAGGVTWVQQ